MAALFKHFDIRMSVVYAIVASLWIVLSDNLVITIFGENSARLMTLNTWKGLGFVAVTTLALFVVISRELRQRNRIEKAEREQRRFAEALRDTLFALTASGDVDHVMQQILDSAATVVPSEAGSIVVFEGNQGRIAYTRGFPPESQTFINEHQFTNQNPQSATAFGNSKPYRIADTRLHPDWVALPFTSWIRSSIGVPIELRGRVIGVLIADSREPNHFQQSDVEKLTSFARYTALALDNAYYVTRLEQEVSERTAQLKSAKIRAEAILNNSLDGILMAFTDLRIQQTNAAFNTLLACDFDDYFEKSILDLIREDDRERVESTLQQVIASQVGKQMEVCARRKDGTHFNVEFSIGYIRDLNDEMDSLVCALRDISERKQAEGALNAKLDEEREFQRHLKTIHEITIELTQLDDLDEFYKQAVLAGRERLNFERFALFLYRDDEVIGTYGTDTQGDLMDERQVHFAPFGILRRALQVDEHVAIDETTILYNAPSEVVGTGWNAAAVLRSGTQELGWVAADNLISHKPAAKTQLDILALYGLTLGTLLARKQTDAALRESEARLRESQQILRNVLEAIPVRVFWKDKNLIFLGANHLFLQDGGLKSSEEIVGKSELEMPWYNQAVSYMADEQEVVETGISHLNHETSKIFLDGSMMWFQSSKVPLRNNTGEIIGILGTYTDITERKQSEEALRAAFEREKELGELKSRFVSMASHELRTPLTSILSAAEILARYRDRMDGPQIEEKLALIARQVAHLADIIEDVLNLGRMQSGHTEYDPAQTDLDALCQDVVAEFQNQPTMTHEVLYRCDQRPVMLYLDRKLMRQVITNLISNAIKYSPASKQVSVNVEQRGESAVLGVHDTGIGIPAQDNKRLFEPFHRARNVGTISGTGLGLAISKEAVERHGGTISVESEVGVGTAVYVHLPING